MNFKEFFRIKKGKVILAISLYLAFLINFIWGIFMRAGQKEPLIRKILFWILAFPFMILNELIESPEGIFAFILIFVILEIIYIYLISSFFYALFRKS